MTDNNENRKIRHTKKEQGEFLLALFCIDIFILKFYSLRTSPQVYHSHT